VRHYIFIHLEKQKTKIRLQDAVKLCYVKAALLLVFCFLAADMQKQLGWCYALWQQEYFSEAKPNTTMVVRK
jgi:hypothetical protein